MIDEPSRGWVFGDDCFMIEGDGEYWITSEALRKRKDRSQQREAFYD